MSYSVLDVKTLCSYEQPHDKLFSTITVESNPKNGSNLSTKSAAPAGSNRQYPESVLDFFRLQPPSALHPERVHSGDPDPRYGLDDVRPTTTEEYLDWLDREVLCGAVNLSSALCMGHMAGPVPNFAPKLSALVASLNQNLVKREASLTFTALERRTVAVLHRLIYGKTGAFYESHAHDSESTLGVMGGGGTIANLTALWIARNSCFPPTADFPGVERAGLCASLDRYGYEGAVIVGAGLMHYSIGKAASILGLGSNEMLSVPVDAENRMDIEALKDCLADCATARKRVLSRRCRLGRSSAVLTQAPEHPARNRAG